MITSPCPTPSRNARRFNLAWLADHVPSVANVRDTAAHFYRTAVGQAGLLGGIIERLNGPEGLRFAAGGRFVALLIF